jgi:nucleoside-diphosphate-sugar epimerase
VLGGSGFIGTQLVATLLKAGHRVRIGDIAPSMAYPDLRVDCDVRDRDQVLSLLQGTEVVFNLAALFRDDVRPQSLYYDINAGGPRNVCEAAERLGVQRLYFTSSSSVYGFSAEEMDEDAPKRPRKDYGRSKLEAERIMQEWYRRGPNRTLVMVRPSVVFGRGNRGNVYEIMRQLARNPYVMIGRGHNLKSLAYVENVAAFLERTLLLDPGEYIYNYADAQISMEDLVRRVRHWLGRESTPLLRVPYPVAYAIGLVCDGASAVTGRRIPIGVNRIQKFCGTTRYSTARASSLGFRAPVDAEEALEETFRWEFSATPAATDPGRVSAES